MSCLGLTCIFFSLIVAPLFCLSINLTGYFFIGNGWKPSQGRLKHMLQTEKDATQVTTAAGWDECSSVRGVRSSAMECFIWLFVLLRVPESTLAENSWQRHIRRGSFKVTAPFWLWALRAFHPSPLKYLCTNDMEDEGPLTGGATEASSCLPPPSINHHITTNPDTT